MIALFAKVRLNRRKTLEGSYREECCTMTEETSKDIRIRSHVYDNMVKSPNRAMLRATGMDDEEFKKPIIGVISTWAENKEALNLYNKSGFYESDVNNDNGRLTIYLEAEI